jgi:4-aminobutyrate aminotransferase
VAMSLSGSKLVHRRGFSPLVPDIHHVAFPRGCTACTQAGAGCACVQQIEETVLARIAPPDEIAAIFVEPIQGEGGYHVSPPDFLPALRRLCDRYGVLMVVDEVQTGMGRTGKLFAVEHWNVEPDIICLAKGIASGMPLGAILASEEIMDWPPGSHASTFGGNPVSCRASLATLDLLEKEYIANAAERGEQLRQGLHRLQRQFPQAGDVRGLGLMTAMDIVQEKDPSRPAANLRDGLIQAAFHRGLLLLGCGESALRFCPPLCVSAEQIRVALDILADVLKDLTSLKKTG